MTATLDTHSLRRLLDDADDVVVIDVRTPSEYESVRIPGSHNLPLDALQRNADRLEDLHGREVVLVCRSGQRATQAQQSLAATGVPHARVLHGGVQAWESAAAPVERGRRRWDLERQVRLVAGTLVLAGIAGSTVHPPLRYLSGAVGGGLALAALSNTCMLGALLSKLPYNRGPRPDIDLVLESLTTGRRRPAGGGTDR